VASGRGNGRLALQAQNDNECISFTSITSLSSNSSCYECLVQRRFACRLVAGEYFDVWATTSNSLLPNTAFPTVTSTSYPVAINASCFLAMNLVQRPQFASSMCSFVLIFSSVLRQRQHNPYFSFVAPATSLPGTAADTSPSFFTITAEWPCVPSLTNGKNKKLAALIPIEV
jgi:hypothetical protein